MPVTFSYSSGGSEILTPSYVLVNLSPSRELESRLREHVSHPGPPNPDLILDYENYLQGWPKECIP